MGMTATSHTGRLDKGTHFHGQRLRLDDDGCGAKPLERPRMIADG
jgi:hypothetical protein